MSQATPGADEGPSFSTDARWDSPRPRTSALTPRDHLVQFYDDEDMLAAAVGKFLYDGLQSGGALVIIATQEHRDAFRRQLERQRVDVTALSASGRLVLLDASDTLATFMRDGEPDRALFYRSVGSTVAALSARLPAGGRLRAYGEMVDVLWRQGQRSAALHLEQLWNELQEQHELTLLCAYAMAGFYKEPGDLEHVCSAHSQVVQLAHRPIAGEPAPAAALPEQTRLAREIAEREEVERALRACLQELSTHRDDLRHSEEQLRDFVENAPVGLHRVGPDGTILWANRAELDSLGYGAAEYIGRNIGDFHADPQVIDDILERLRRRETLHDYEARLKARDGSLRTVLISSSVYAPDGTFVHTRCFTRDVTERRRAELALHEREEQLRLIADALPVLVSFIDSTGRYRFVSAAYERWFGRSRADVEGMHLRDVLGSDAYDVIGPHVARALAGEPVTFEASVPYRDAGSRFVEATYLPQRTVDGTVSGFVALVADISERKRVEKAQQESAARAEKLLKITAAIADAVSDSQVFEAVVDRVAEAVDASSAAMWLVESESQARLARSQGFSPAARRELELLPLDMTPSIPVLDAIRRGEAIWIPSSAALLERYPHLDAIRTPGRSYRIACLPLIVQGRVLGALALTLEAEGQASEEEREFLQLVARYAGQAVERLRLLEAERASREAASAAARRLAVLSRASRAFAASELDLDSRLRSIVSELAAALDSCVNVTLLQPDGLLHPIAVQHPIPEAQALLTTLAPTAPLQLGEGVTGALAATGEPIILNDIAPITLAERAVPTYRAFLQRFPVFALIGAPLKVQGRIIGVVTATRVRPGESYTEDDLGLLDELGERAAVTIENGRLYEETVGARARAEQLYRFAQAVVGAERIEAVYDAALTSIQAALGTRRVAVLTFDPDGVMRFKAWYGLSDAYRAAVEGHSPWSRDAVAPAPVLVPDATLDPAMESYLPLFRSEGIGALAFIPLVAGGRLLGKFMVYHDHPHAFTAQELETAGGVASHLASVILRFFAVTKLEETIQHNELFAGVLAHDLRNPLAAMMMAAQVLLVRREGRSGGDDGEGKPLGRIVSSGQRMTTMIDQLLDFTRARSGGGIEVQRHATDLADLCGQAVSELELSHPSWKISCEVRGDSRGTWDSHRLLQVLSNLVGNAGQHGDRTAPIAITVDGTAAEQVSVEVHNQGTIPQTLLPQLFDPFRGTQHRRDQSRGLGLGLFIVREIVRGHGGLVQVSSSEAEGTTFTIRLPR